MTLVRLARTFLAIALLALSVPAHAQTDAASAAFRDGVTAAHGGDYEQALRHFEAARAAGMNTPQLHFNLGVSYHQTGNPEAARRAFREAARSPELAGPARYQIGIVALDEGDTEAARQAFLEAQEVAQTERLQEAIRRQLAALDAPPTPHTPRRGRAFVALEGGYDSNVVKTDDALRTTTDNAMFTDLLGWGQYRLTPPHAADIRISGTLNARIHPGESDADLLYVQASPTWHTRAGEWRTRLGLQADEFRLNSHRVERTAGVVAGANRAFPEIGQLRTRLRLNRTSGGSGFDHLDGYSHDLRIALHRVQDAFPWYLRYDLIHEDRDDIHNPDGTFQSASPVRHGITAGIRPVLEGGTRLEFIAGWRVSRYRDSDILATGERIRREDTRLRLEAGVLHSLTGDWNATGRIQFLDNRSNRDDFEYDRLQVSIGLERAF